MINFRRELLVIHIHTHLLLFVSKSCSWVGVPTYIKIETTIVCTLLIRLLFFFTSLSSRCPLASPLSVSRCIPLSFSFRSTTHAKQLACIRPQGCYCQSFSAVLSSGLGNAPVTRGKIWRAPLPISEKKFDGFVSKPALHTTFNNFFYPSIEIYS